MSVAWHQLHLQLTNDRYSLQQIERNLEARSYAAEVSSVRHYQHRLHLFLARDRHFLKQAEQAITTRARDHRIEEVAGLRRRRRGEAQRPITSASGYRSRKDEMKDMTRYKGVAPMQIYTYIRYLGIIF